MDTADNALLQENIILKAELAVARAKNSEDAALIAAQKLQIAKLQHHIHGQKSERSARIKNGGKPEDANYESLKLIAEGAIISARKRLKES